MFISSESSILKASCFEFSVLTLDFVFHLPVCFSFTTFLIFCARSRLCTQLTENNHHVLSFSVLDFFLTAALQSPPLFHLTVLPLGPCFLSISQVKQLIKVCKDSFLNWKLLRYSICAGICFRNANNNTFLNVNIDTIVYVKYVICLFAIKQKSR